MPKRFTVSLGSRFALEWWLTGARSQLTSAPASSTIPTAQRTLTISCASSATVSLETVKIVGALTDLGLPKEHETAANAPCDCSHQSRDVEALAIRALQPVATAVPHLFETFGSQDLAVRKAAADCLEK